MNEDIQTLLQTISGFALQPEPGHCWAYDYFDVWNPIVKADIYTSQDRENFFIVPLGILSDSFFQLGTMDWNSTIEFPAVNFAGLGFMYAREIVKYLFKLKIKGPNQVEEHLKVKDIYKKLEDCVKPQYEEMVCPLLKTKLSISDCNTVQWKDYVDDEKELMSDVLGKVV